MLSEFTAREFEFARQEVVFAKKMPLPSCRCAFEIGAGVIYERDVKYKGSLADPQRNAFTFVLRPNLEF